jgi:hypothetical protein
MGAGERGAGSGIGVERVFDHVMPGGADGVDEELAGEFGQGEAGADFGAVDAQAGGTRRDLLFPIDQRCAGGIVEAEPQADGAGAVAGPVIGGDEGGGEAVRLAEEGIVGGEVEPV